MSPRAQVPWWLDGGSANCNDCTHLYALQMEFRCVACDRGLCCLCVRVTVASGEVLCRECEAAAGED